MMLLLVVAKFLVVLWSAIGTTYTVECQVNPPSVVIEHQQRYQQLIQSYENDSCITHWLAADEMKDYLFARDNAHRCIITLTGATWDGHFKRYLELQIYKRAAQLFCDYEGSTFGIYFYQDKKLPRVVRYPNTDSQEVVWQESDGSYEVYAFRSGTFIDSPGTENNYRRVRHWLRSLQDWNSVSDAEIEFEVKRWCGIGTMEPYSS